MTFFLKMEPMIIRLSTNHVQHLMIKI